MERRDLGPVPGISGVESLYRCMSGEGQSAFKCQRKEKVCKNHRVQACGTPNEMGAGSVVGQWMLTDWVRFLAYDENHSKAVPCSWKS